MLQEIDQVEIEVDERVVDIAGVRLLHRGFGLIQAVERQVGEDESPIGAPILGIKFRGFLSGGKTGRRVDESSRTDGESFHLRTSIEMIS
jgi:hypothetical protein